MVLHGDLWPEWVRVVSTGAHLEGILTRQGGEVDHMLAVFGAEVVDIDRRGASADRNEEESTREIPGFRRLSHEPTNLG